MTHFNNQLIVIAEYSKKYNSDTKGPNGKSSSDFTWLKNKIDKKQLIFTSLLPGPEMQAAIYAYKTKVPFIAVIPYKEYPNFWSKAFRNQYFKLLKKAVKVVYVDREPGYISNFYPPDLPGPGKEGNQIEWLMSRPPLSPGVTQIIHYAQGTDSIKERDLQFFLKNTHHKQEYYCKWNLSQRIDISLDYDPSIDLPF
jgi:hypothetical protein